MRSYPKWILLAGLLLAPALLHAGEPASRNQRMADRIAGVLQNQGDFAGCRIMIEYTGGTATLKGTVHTPWQRYEALQLAEGVRGVRDVVDGLDVLSHEAPSLAQTQPVLPPVQYAAQSAPAAPPALPAAAPRQVQTARGWYLQEETPAPPPATMPQQSLAAMPSYTAAAPAPVRYDLPHFPPYAWPSYASYPNYASLTYPQQYSPTAWPYIGPFYPYPQVPLGWRKVTLQWDDGWWFLKFKGY